YSLEHDTLKIHLPEKMEKGDQVKVEISYRFTLPEEGSGFLKADNHYYLAQWYPMLANFQDGKWNKEDFSDGFKTHHTDFSDYKVHYEIPKGFSFISTADEDPSLEENKGDVEINRVRE